MRQAPALVATFAALLLVDTGPAGVRAQDTALPARPTFVTKHSGTFNGQKVDYTAAVAPTVLADDKGRPEAILYSIAYVRAGGGDPAMRPVLFLFNGGPGAASVYLHMGAFGPKRVVLPADVNADIKPPYEVADNTCTILDVADLVFIDPAGTGYSRLAPGVDPKPFYTAPGDAQSVARFIQAWAKANNRERSPKYVMGESYGTIRAVLVADELARIAPLDGIILFGQAVNIVETVQRAGNIVGYAVNLPSLTAVAWYHNLIPRNGRTLEALLDESYAFGTGEYLLALAKGRDLPEKERRAIAVRLEQLTGLGAAYYLTRNLVVSKQEYRREILRDKGLFVGMYDARCTGLPGRGDPSMKHSEAFGTVAQQHITGNLGVTLADEYRRMDPAASIWDYGNGAPSSPFTDFDFAEAITRAMAASPAFKVLIGTGVYDTSTTTGAARYLMARGTFPAERVTVCVYEGGHMAYTNDAALAALTADVRAFVTGK